MSTNQQSRLDKLKIRSHPAPDEFGTPASPPTAPAPDVDNMDLDSGSSHSSSKVPIEGAAPMDVNQMAAPTAGAVAPDSQSIPAASQLSHGPVEPNTPNNTVQQAVYPESNHRAPLSGSGTASSHTNPIDYPSLDTKIAALQQWSSHCADDMDMLAAVLSRLSDLLHSRFQHSNKLSDLRNAVESAEQVISISLSTGHPRLNALLDHFMGLQSQLNDLSGGNAATSRPRPGESEGSWVNRWDNVRQFDVEIKSLQEDLEVQRRANDYSSMASTLLPLSALTYQRFEVFNDPNDLHRAISLTEQALDIVPDSHAHHASFFANLGVFLDTRFRRSRDLADLDRAIASKQRAVALTPDDHSDKARWLMNLGSSFRSRFERFSELADLGHAIKYQEQAVALTPDDHHDKGTLLTSLGESLHSQFDRLGNISDLGRAIAYLERALALTPDDQPSDRAYRLDSLGTALMTRFVRFSGLPDLKRAIEIQQEAIALTPEGHLAQATRINNLGRLLESRFDRLGDLTDLEHAIKSKQQAIALTPEGNASKVDLNSSLGRSLARRFHRLGDIADLDRAVESEQWALAHTPDDDPASRMLRFGHLAADFTGRFDHLGELADLGHAIEYLRQAVALAPDDDPAAKATLLSNLGGALGRRFDRLGEVADLDCAIESEQRANALIPDDHAHKAQQLCNLGSSFQTRFNRRGTLADLDCAIEYKERAVALTPDDHADKATMLTQLGSAMSRHRELAYTDRPLECIRRAVALSPESHPNRALRLKNLGILLINRYERLGERADLDQALEAFSRSAKSKSSKPSVRLGGAQEWARLCVANRQHLDPNAAIEAYSVVVELVPRITSLGRTILQRYEDMSVVRLGEAITEAVAEAIHCGLIELAVEWLEQGRSIIWGQVLQLRSPIDELSQKHAAEAKQLVTLSQALEDAATSDTNSTFTITAADSSDIPTVATHAHRRLGEEYEQLLERIRAFDGFDAFLRPKRFVELRKAASSGPVVVVNIHKERCDALIIHSSSPTTHSPPTHIPLPALNMSSGRTLQLKLAGLIRTAEPPRHVVQYDNDGLNESGSRRNDHFANILEQLWVNIAQPVLDHLGFLKQPSDGDIPHITWCVTGPLTFLPIHAAGRYQEANGPRALDLVVSSYTPTLTAILNRKDRHRESSTDKIQVLGVSQPTGLPYTKVEIETIRDLCDSRLDLHWLNDKEASKEAVLRHMKTCNWVHLACHGTQNGTESAFHLADGKLTLRDILKNSHARSDVPKDSIAPANTVKNPPAHAELAILSACQTAMGDEQMPEEAIHLAAGMLMTGYSSVVATMWSILDPDGPIIARELYKHLLEEGRGDSTKAAYALHHAVNCLRQTVGEKEFVRWVPFIHLGV